MFCLGGGVGDREGQNTIDFSNSHDGSTTSQHE